MANVPSALTEFVSDLETLVANEQDQGRVAIGVQARLPDLLRQPGFLAPEYRQPDMARYQSHLLAVAPSRRFSVVSLVWLPGQVTSIHDHIAWCVVGVLQGDECERRYGLRQSPDGDRRLVPLEESRLEVGGISILVPPEENIHQVRNVGSDLALSIHVYGADLAVWGSSINQCFDHLCIRSGDFSGAIVKRNAEVVRKTRLLWSLGANKWDEKQATIHKGLRNGPHSCTELYGNTIRSVLHFHLYAERKKAVMEYRTLGKTGVRVSPFCLGAMMFGQYGDPDHVVLATKVHFAMGDDPNQQGNSRRWIMQEVENSLRRLKTDWIDLYQIHRPEPDTDIEETMGALSDLV